MRKLFDILMIFAMLVSSSAMAGGDVAAGKESYDKLCASCHGMSGKGDGVASAALNPKPRNFSDKGAMSKLEDNYLKKVIKEGGAAVQKSPSMPPWQALLKDADVENVIAYIRTLAK